MCVSAAAESRRVATTRDWSVNRIGIGRRYRLKYLKRGDCVLERTMSARRYANVSTGIVQFVSPICPIRRANATERLVCVHRARRRSRKPTETTTRSVCYQHGIYVELNVVTDDGPPCKRFGDLRPILNQCRR